MNAHIRAVLIATSCLYATLSMAQDGEISEELRNEKEKTAILLEMQKQAEARKAIAVAEKEAESAAVQAEKEISAILAEQQKQAEAVRTINAAQMATESAAVLAAKEESTLLEEQKKQATAKKEIAEAEFGALTAGVTPDSEPLTGTVSGTVKTYIPQLLVYQSLEYLCADIAKDLNSLLTKKSVMITNNSSRTANSLVALQAFMFLEEFNTALPKRTVANVNLISKKGGKAPDHEDNLSTARSGIIPGLGAVGTAISTAADIAGLFKSEYTAVSVEVETDQNSLNSVLADKLTQDTEVRVLDIKNINIDESDSVQNFLSLSNHLTELKNSIGKIQVIINLLESEEVAQKNALAAARAELSKIEDTHAQEHSEAKDRITNLEEKQAAIEAQIKNLEYAKEESNALHEAAKQFSVQLTAVPEGGRSIFMEMALQEIRKDVDFVLDASVVGAGGEGYIDRRLFLNTKLSLITGVNVRYELIDKEGTVVAAGMKGKSYAADYKLRKPEKIEVAEIRFEEVDQIVSGNVPKQTRK